MKLTCLLYIISLVGCAAHNQLKCRFTAVSQGKILDKETEEIHKGDKTKGWHKGWNACVVRIEAVSTGYLITTNGYEVGLEVKGPKKERERLKDYFKNDTEKEGKEKSKQI